MNWTGRYINGLTIYILGLLKTPLTPGGEGPQIALQLLLGVKLCRGVGDLTWAKISSHALCTAPKASKIF